MFYLSNSVVWKQSDLGVASETELNFLNVGLINLIYNLTRQLTFENTILYIFTEFVCLIMTLFVALKYLDTVKTVKICIEANSLPQYYLLTFICGTDSPVSMASSTMQRPLSSSTSQGTKLSWGERPIE